MEEHIKSAADYTGSKDYEYPIGTGSEVINQIAMRKLLSLNVDLSYSEYMTFYFQNNPDIFQIHFPKCPKEFNRPDYRLTIDYIEDLEMVREIFRHFKPGRNAIPLKHTISFLDDHPKIAAINKKLPLQWRANIELIEKINEATRIKQ